MSFLRDMTAESPGRDKLTVLYHMLDPEGLDQPVNWESFHSTMSRWISQCADDGVSEDESPTLDGERCRLLTDGTEYSLPEVEPECPEESNMCPCDSVELINLLEELKLNRRRLEEQNHSLRITVSHCEDTNLQLILEITELRSKLASAQRSSCRLRSLTEELDEARRLLSEQQDHVSRAQACSSDLLKENEHLKTCLGSVEQKNENLVHEKCGLEALVCDLREASADMREELRRTRDTLAQKDREMNTKTAVLSDRAISHLNIYKRREELQEENTQQEHLRCRSDSASLSVMDRCSLQAEVEESRKITWDMKRVESPATMCDTGSACQPAEPLQQHEEINQHTLKPPQAVDGAGTGRVHGSLVSAYLRCQQQLVSTMKQLADMKRELDLEKSLRQQIQEELVHCGQMLTEAQWQVQETSWSVWMSRWRALELERGEARTREAAIQLGHTQKRTHERLKNAQEIIQELREKVCGLEEELVETRRRLERNISHQAEDREVCGRACPSHRLSSSHPIGTRTGTSHTVDTETCSPAAHENPEKRAGGQAVGDHRSESAEHELTVTKTAAHSEVPDSWARPPAPHIMATLPEEDEEEDSPEEQNWHKPAVSSTPAEKPNLTGIIPAPSVVHPRPANMAVHETKPPEVSRTRLSRHSPSPGNSMTTVDSGGHVINLLKDPLPELQLSEEDKRKNLELLEEAKKVSERFLSRRGRRSTCSLSESPTGVSPCPTPRSSPVPARCSPIPTAAETSELNPSPLPASQLLEVPAIQEQEQEKPRLLELQEKRKVSSGTLSPHSTTESDTGNQSVTLEKAAVQDGGGARTPRTDAPNTGVAKPVPRPPAQQTPCTAEIKTLGAFPPLMRAVTWDTVGPVSPRDSFSMSSGYKDFPMQPSKVHKLAKMREENKLIRNQSMGGSKLPDLSESTEQDRASPTEEEPKESVTPSITDVMLRKLKLHRALPGSAPALTEKEVENAFVQLSLAFRNDNYTLETRLRHAERERNLMEENTEKELEEFTSCLKGSACLWQNMEQREMYQRMLDTVAVLLRLATRLSSRAEMVGAVRQEKRMNKATEVMMQYVENLKRTYEKDHSELMEFKKLANQNSSRSYGSSPDAGDDGVPRASRSMSLTLGKALPRRRVSVAVVPKFNLLNIPGQTSPAGAPTLPSVSEATGGKANNPAEAAQQTGSEKGKTALEPEVETPSPGRPAEEINSQLRARIEEDAYNKGYQEGLKRSKELQEEEQKMVDVQEENDLEKKPSRFAVDALDRMFHKVLRHNRAFWAAVSLLGLMFFTVSIFMYFSGRPTEPHNPPAGKSVGPGKKFFGWNVGMKNAVPE